LRRRVTETAGTSGAADMDRAMLEAHLAQAERHVAEGERHLARQREIVAQLKDHGHDWREAMNLLHQFEDMQALHVADRDLLRKELGL
jgi:hypothetical protein